MNYIDNETAKPVVLYGSSAFVEVDRRAMLFDVKNHPRLGDCNYVSTSRVLSVSDDGTIETLNTIYKRVVE